MSTNASTDLTKAGSGLAGGLAAGFAAGVAVSAAAWYFMARKSGKGGTTADKSRSGAALARDLHVPRPLKDNPELLDEQLSRITAFFGPDAASRLRGASVIVVGVGGVGSHAANLLARSGVKMLRLIDFDQVSLSSLNRHATATRDDVGTSKVAALARCFGRIVPSCDVQPVQQLFEAKFAEQLLFGVWRDGAFVDGQRQKPDFVLDCIDDTATKADLLHFCYVNSIPVISSLGAGGKADPSRLHIADLAVIRTEPLAVALKKHMKKANLCGMGDSSELNGSTLGYNETIDPLRGRMTAADLAAVCRNGVPGSKAGKTDDCVAVRMTGIQCVYSSELPRAELLPLELGAGDTPQDFGALPGFRVRVIPVLGTMPAMFGQTLAAYTICALAGNEHKLEPSEMPSLPYRALYRIYSRFGELDKGEYLQPRSSLNVEDVIFLVTDAYRQRSVLTPGDRWGVRGLELILCRWDRYKPSLPSNIVLVTEEQAAFLVKWTGETDLKTYVDGAFGAGTADRVEARRKYVQLMGYD